APLATLQDPVTNSVTGQVFTTNSPADALLRAPLQGVSITGFSLTESSAASSYNSLQLTATARLIDSLQILAAYTFAKSIDSASGLGGGSGISGVANNGALNDSSQILGDQNDSRANRGPSDFDRTHRFVLSYVWRLPNPILVRQSHLERSVIWNWQTS